MEVSFWQNFRAIFFNVFHSPHAAWLQITGKIQARGVYFKNCEIRIKRGGNIKIGAGTRLRFCELKVYAGTLEIGENCRFSKAQISVDENSTIEIGDRFTMERHCEIAAGEGTSVVIGNDCMFSNHIEIRSTDSHKIVDQISRERKNFGRDIFIGDHVWLTAGVCVLKGAKIGDHCVIGSRSLVIGDCSKSNSVYAGVPAKFIKSGIDWER